MRSDWILSIASSHVSEHGQKVDIYIYIVILTHNGDMTVHLHITLWSDLEDSINLVLSK